MKKYLRWTLLVVLIALLLSPAANPVLAQSGTPDDSVASIQLQETASLPWFVAVLIFIAVAVGLTVFRNRYQATQKKTIIYTTC